MIPLLLFCLDSIGRRLKVSKPSLSSSSYSPLFSSSFPRSGVGSMKETEVFLHDSASRTISDNLHNSAAPLANNRLPSFHILKPRLKAARLSTAVRRLDSGPRTKTWLTGIRTQWKFKPRKLRTIIHARGLFWHANVVVAGSRTLV